MPAAGLAAESGAPILFVTPGGVPRRDSDGARQPAPPGDLRDRLLQRGRAQRCDELSRFGSVTTIAQPASATEGGPVANAIDDRALHRRQLRLGGQRTRPRAGVRQRRASARRAGGSPAVGDRRLRAAAAARSRPLIPPALAQLSVATSSRPIRAPRSSSRSGRLQSRLADRRRTCDLGRDAGRNRLPAGDQPAHRKLVGSARRMPAKRAVHVQPQRGQLEPSRGSAPPGRKQSTTR